MKINEVETLVGVTRRNIRFYEKEGLLMPPRNNQNGYREYGEKEVEELKRIKLLRKLGLPLDEIRRLQSGNGTVADGMRRHLISLEREQKNLEQSILFCQNMKDQETKLSELDAEVWLKEMEVMEQEGTMFQNKQRGDFRIKRYVPAVIAAIVMVILMGALTALMIWAITVDPIGAPPWPLLVVLIGIPLVVIFGVLFAMIQRWREIGRGEEDEARKY